MEVEALYKNDTVRGRMLENARGFVNSPLSYVWTKAEKGALEPFFSNLDRRIFFVQGLPPHVGSALFAMFSRLRNSRGIRGVFVDAFLPQVLAAGLAEVEDGFGGDEARFLKHRGIYSLDSFVQHSPETRAIFSRFVAGMRGDPAITRLLTESQKVRKFLDLWLDKYGHNSIARTGTVWIGFEQISILALKSLEWARPGSAQIELSTRYVDFSGKDCYPIAEELASYGAARGLVEKVISFSFGLYRKFAGEDFSGAFSEFLREYWAEHPYFAGNPKELETGVVGETCDVLGNLLPAATLSSAGFSISGEALPSVLKHLLLDNTPENFAIAEAVIEESKKTGAIQFCRHYEPTEWEREMWQYLALQNFDEPVEGYGASYAVPLSGPSRDAVESTLFRLFRLLEDFRNLNSFDEVINYLASLNRGEHDKFSRPFESVTIPFEGVMSFRDWRDLQRQSLSTHLRTFLTTKLGFYRYGKPAPPELREAFEALYQKNRELEEELERKGVPAILRQYPLALGNNVGFLMSSNLRQWEFCNWQRTKWSVNHEVRQTFLAIENALRQLYPWWQSISRADMTPAYIFARGKTGIPLPSQ